MHLYEVIWKGRYVEKLAVKHGVNTDEVEAVLFKDPFVRFWEKGKVQGEDLYTEAAVKGCVRPKGLFRRYRHQHHLPNRAKRTSYL